MLGSIARRSFCLPSRRSATKTRKLRNLRRNRRRADGTSAGRKSWERLMLGSIARRSVVLSSRRSATKTRELRNLRRASRGTSSISARTPTRSVSVSHPTLGGLTERVERVVDTLDDAQGGPPQPPLPNERTHRERPWKRGWLHS